MTNIKNSIYAILMLITMSCGREEVLEGYNSEPRITLFSATDSGNEISDSLKVSGISGLYFYEVGIRIEDINGNLEKVSIDSTTTLSSLIIQSDSILINYFIVDLGSYGDSVVLELALFDLGIRNVQLSVIDQFGKNGSATLSLSVFNNLKPIAKVSVSNNTIDSNIKHINLEESYDLDERFGGEIFSYSYVINGVEHLNIGSNEWKETFSQPGDYPVTVWVTDNNNEKSEVVSWTITVN